MDASDHQAPARVSTITMDTSVTVLLAPVGPALREKIDQEMDNNPSLTLLMRHLASSRQESGALTMLKPGYTEGLIASSERLRLIQRAIYRSGFHNRIIFIRQGSSFERIAYIGLGTLDPMEGFGEVLIDDKRRMRKRDTCTYCGFARPFKLKLCSRCKVARYCNTSCQTAHWRIHSISCHPDREESH